MAKACCTKLCHTNVKAVLKGSRFIHLPNWESFPFLSPSIPVFRRQDFWFSLCWSLYSHRNDQIGVWCAVLSWRARGWTILLHPLRKTKVHVFCFVFVSPPPLPPLKGLYTFELDFLSTYLAVHLSAEYGWLCLICLAITSLWSGREF